LAVEWGVLGAWEAWADAAGSRSSVG